MSGTQRALSALEDVVDVEPVAPGLFRVTSWSDVYTVDLDVERCTCPDQQYHLDEDERGKHQWAAILATADVPAPWEAEEGGSQTAETVEVPA